MFDFKSQGDARPLVLDPSTGQPVPAGSGHRH
jgi:hypothetical protein